MILFLEYGVDTPGLDATIYETRKEVLDLIGSDISTLEFDPGFFDNPLQLITQATAKLNLHGRPALVHATHMIGRFQTHVLINVGRDFGLNAYLVYSPTDDTQLHRARIYALQFRPEGDSGYFNAPNRNLSATLIITHGVWQGNLKEIPLKNSNTSDVYTLGGIQIDNTKDGTYDNRALISGSDIEGDIPAPIKLKITNINAIAVHIYQYWIGLNTNSAPGAFVHQREGENAMPLDNKVTADGSNGNSNAITVSSTTEALKLTWTMSANDMLDTAGNQFHIFIRNHWAKTFSNNIFWRFEVKDSGNLGTMWRGEQVYFPGAGANLNIGDYGVVRLPPFRVDRENYAPAGILLNLYCAQITAAAAIEQYIDALHLFPADGFRNLIFHAYLDKNDYLIDDMIENNLYQYWAGTGNTGSVNALGNAIMIRPLRDQALYFLCNHAGGDSADLSSKVQAWYRPQRLVI